MNKASEKIILLVLIATACLASLIIVPALPAIGNFYGLEDSQIGFLISIYLFGYLSGQVIYSFISKSASPKTALQVGFKVFIVGSLAQIISIYVHSSSLLFIGRFICALGASSGLICGFAIIKELFTSANSKKMISLAFISLTIFSYISMLLGGIITTYLGWEMIFFFTLVIAICYYWLIHFYVPSFKLPNQANTKITNTYLHYIRSLKSIELILSSIIVAFTTTSTYLYSSTASIISSHYFHLSSNYFGIFSLLNLLGLILGGYFSSILTKKYKPIFVVFLGLIFVFISVALLCFFTEIVLENIELKLFFFVFTAILNIGLGVIYPSASYIALNAIECSSTTSSIMNFIKIGCPAIVLVIASHFKTSIISNFEGPLFVCFFVTLFCWAILYIKGRCLNKTATLTSYASLLE